MYREYGCGCVVSEQQGRVCICPTHRPHIGDGYGAVAQSVLRGRARYYPANGVPVPGWNGGK